MDKRIVAFIAFNLFAVRTFAVPTAQMNDATLTAWAKTHNFVLGQAADGGLFYCKSYMGIGSHIPYKRCVSESLVAHKIQQDGPHWVPAFSSPNEATGVMNFP